MATEIAERHDFKQIDAIIHKFASALSDKRRKLELAELFRKAKRNAEASRVLNALAVDLSSSCLNPIAIKKVFILAALETHLQAKRIADPGITSNLTNITLSSLAKDLTR